MWLIYNQETFKVYGRYYTKTVAKENLKRVKVPYSCRKLVNLTDIGLIKEEKWLMWKKLQA